MQLYKISFPAHLTNKVYIGITTKTAQERFKNHLYFARHSKSAVGKAIRKYGKENVIITVLAECNDWDELKKMEIAAIALHNSRSPNGYNKTDGGEGTLGFFPSDETREKMSKSQLIAAKIRTPEQIERRNNAVREIVKKPEYKAKISTANIKRHAKKLLKNEGIINPVESDINRKISEYLVSRIKKSLDNPHKNAHLMTHIKVLLISEGILEPTNEDIDCKISKLYEEKNNELKSKKIPKYILKQREVEERQYMRLFGKLRES